MTDNTNTPEQQALKRAQDKRLAFVDFFGFGQDERDQLAASVQRIPPENLQQPPAITMAKVSEGFRLSEDAPNLRKMYIDLLAASMDREKADLVRAGFAEIIHQLNPDEARILTLFSDNAFIPVIDVVLLTDNKDAERPLRLNFSHAGIDAECRSPQHAPLYLDKLRRLGLIDKHNFTTGLSSRRSRKRASFDFKAIFQNLIESPELEHVYFDEEFYEEAKNFYQRHLELETLYSPETLEEYIARQKKVSWDFINGIENEFIEITAPTIRKSVFMLTAFGRAFCHHCLPISDANQDDPRLNPEWHPNPNIEDLTKILAEQVSSNAIRASERQQEVALRKVTEQVGSAAKKAADASLSRVMRNLRNH